MNILVTGSVAYDYLMIFPGYFRDHILLDKLEIDQPLIPGREHGPPAWGYGAQYRVYASPARFAGAFICDCR